MYTLIQPGFSKDDETSQISCVHLEWSNFVLSSSL